MTLVEQLYEEWRLNYKILSPCQMRCFYLLLIIFIFFGQSIVKADFMQRIGDRVYATLMALAIDNF